MQNLTMVLIGTKRSLCIPPTHDYEATARPSVFKHQNKYIMLYSKRDLREFRHNSKFSYRLVLLYQMMV